MVTAALGSDSNQPLPATPPSAPPGNDPTFSATPTASLECQPSADAGHVRDPERYQILCEHGRGGLGRVSRAHDRSLGRDVAIKELITPGPISELRFVREALITARLEHPGIVPVHEAGRWPDGTPFYAMKLVAGRSLRDLIAERTTVDQRIGLLHHVIAVADAIAYAHGRNIIHRDLKPANVIVGEFGETVVIDWGLAKDLTLVEESTTGGDAPRALNNGDLTAAGAVLGTPSYMPPEQERGEAVDQRADVFAIGAMLWELCSLHKVPPADLRHRHRLLRRASIDKDLAVIIDKTLHSDPRRRYPDASALATDLKAFKAGARITARNYSLFAMLAHWTRRRRTMALSLTVATILSAIASLLYVRNVTKERDRADSALRRTEEAINDLALEHAELLLHTDPTTAMSALASYHGPNTSKALQIAAEAQGRGIARVVLNGHSDTIHVLAGLSDGSILSVAEDHNILFTKNGRTIALAKDVATPVVASYSSVKHLLAYSSQQTGVILMDVESHQATRLTTTTPFAIAFTDDGTRIATLDQNARIVLWTTESQLHESWQRTIPEATNLLFAGPAHLIVSIPNGFQVISLMGPRDASLIVDAEAFDASSDYLATGDKRGIIHVFEMSTLRELSSVAACSERIGDVRIIPQRNAIAFACHEGSAGIAKNPASVTVRDRFPTQGPAYGLGSSDDGRLLLVTSLSTTAYIHDIDSRLTYHYEGQAAVLSAISASTDGVKQILTGDINGTIRSWALPSTDAHVAVRSSTTLRRAAISPDGELIALGASDGTITLSIPTKGEQRTVSAHDSPITSVRFIMNGEFLVSYGSDGKAIVWRCSDMSVIRKFTRHQGAIAGLDLVNHDRIIVTVGNDGHVFAWSPEGRDTKLLFSNRFPLSFVHALANDDTLVVTDVAGFVWHLHDNKSTLIRESNGDQVTTIRPSSDGRFVGIGTSRDHATIMDSRTWTSVREIEIQGSVREIIFSPDSSLIALASESRHVQLISLMAGRKEAWHDISLDARDISFSPDGRLLAIVCAQGGIWFYSIERDSWKYVQDHHTLTSWGRFSKDGLRFMSADRDGVVVVRNITYSDFQLKEAQLTTPISNSIKE